ncbi:hypothetical protein XA68_18375 [Ophiocordyceps unilateralis]|uniref:Uncharacterized protein n=1 Tax=Ophiocordyceps unilateralis TaxID=268505 RepID=A0A2A9P3D2_OPHUN|nr:hypothetical protein XA68_18375 [Ophiocordyceps unilateralis]
MVFAIGSSGMVLFSPCPRAPFGPSAVRTEADIRPSPSWRIPSATLLGYHIARASGFFFFDVGRQGDSAPRRKGLGGLSSVGLTRFAVTALSTRLASVSLEVADVVELVPTLVCLDRNVAVSGIF